MYRNEAALRQTKQSLAKPRQHKHTGKWLIVTNYTSIKIVSTATPLEI